MSDDSNLAFLAGESALANLMRRADWSQSRLGAPQAWPQSLRSVVNVMLGSRFPMFVAWGPQLAMLYNDAYADILGRKHPQSLGSPFDDVWADIRHEIMPFVQRAMSGEAFYVEDLPLRMHRRGFEEQTWFTFSYSPVRNEAGDIAGFFCACVETTKTVVAQQQQRAREEWLTSLFDQAPGFAAVLRGPEHVFEMVNEAYRRITGYRSLEGKPLAEALPEVVAQGFGDLLREVYSTGKPFVGRAVPVTVAREAGEPAYEAYVDFMFQPLRDTEGRVEAIFIQGHDVTEQYRAQQALRDADRQKDEFLATLAHELRNPLAPIRTASHLLQRPELTPQARERTVRIIARQVDHMARLLDDLIDVARVTQKRLVLRKADVRVGDVVEAALEAARPLAEAKGHELVLQLEAKEARVHADPVRLTQVLTNLLNNAVKYTDPGGTIRLGAWAEDDWLQLVVEDNGMGMDPEALDSLFVMFSQREEALARAEGGLGIGLALVKGLMELHGGTVTAESAGPDQGSRFELRLPLGATQSRAARGDPPGAGVAASGTSILVADDNHDAAELLAESLRLNGFQVETATDGAEAQAAAMRLRPQVLVLDIGMPGRSGYEVAQHVRAQPWGAGAVLIAATGCGQLSDRAKTRGAGFDAHLTKPFTVGELVSAIAEAKRTSGAWD